VSTYFLGYVLVESVVGLPNNIYAYNNLDKILIGTVATGDFVKISIKEFTADNTYEVYLNDVLVTPSRFTHYSNHVGPAVACLIYSRADVNAGRADTFSVTSDAPAGWTGTINGVTNPAKINGIAVANISKVGRSPT
jgi:hypothetical protein